LSEFVAAFGLLSVIWGARTLVLALSRLRWRVTSQRLMDYGIDIVCESCCDHCEVA